jgi:hypothetical protein
MKSPFERNVFTAFLILSTLSACGTPRLPTAEGVDPTQQVKDGQLLPGASHLRPEVCKGVDLTPESTRLDERSLTAFFEARGLPSRIERARADLFYIEVQVNPNRDEWARLRVAILNSPAQAGRELHDALLEHGPGSWGVHRANIAVLAPAGTLRTVVAFAAKTQLACWGVLTLADRDDVFVIPGAYREL